MVLMYLFNLMCAIVSCDPYFQPPVPRPYVEGTENSFLREFRSGRNLDFGDNSSVPIDWKPDPIVHTKSGTVEGYFMKVVSGRDIYAFEGIPYGEPPVGDRRFRDPVPKRRWNGIRQAKRPGNSCMQLHFFKLGRVTGSEDCLFINIYTPMIPIEDYNPNYNVLIFLHGGAFIFGSGHEYGPALLLQKNVVLVTVNYRVGPLGFLSTGDEEAPGNWGLKDQALAIKWVSENIKWFGGNSSAITLMGQSAGAACAHLQMMSNLSKNSFHRAISMSGSALNFWAVHTPHQARKWAEKLARFMRCPTSSSSEMMRCFRRRNPNFLVSNQWNLFEILGFPPVVFRPVIESDLPGAFLTISPEEAYKKGQVAKIPFLVTGTKDEVDYIVLLFKSMGVYRIVMRNFERTAPILLDYRRITNNTVAITDAIRKFYYNGTPLRDIHRTSGKEFNRIGTDRFFSVGIRKTLKSHSHIAAAYSYIFSLTNSKGFANLFGQPPEAYGVSHAEDLQFLFNSSVYYESFDTTSDQDMQTVDLMVNLFSNFITKGEPLYTGDDGKDYRIWEPVKDPDNPVFLQIDKQVEMISDPLKPEMEFWESLKLNDSYAYEYA